MFTCLARTSDWPIKGIYLQNLVTEFATVCALRVNIQGIGGHSNTDVIYEPDGRHPDIEMTNIYTIIFKKVF